MKDERILFDMYCSDSDLLPNIQMPFRQDGHICATDGHMLIRIVEKMCEGEYYETVNGLTPPNISKVIPEPDIDVPLTIKMINKALEKAPEEKDRRCPECNGEGNVTWTYTDRLYNKHEMQAQCPECDGTGELYDYTAVKYQFDFMGCCLCYFHLKTLLKTMEILHTDTLHCRHAQQPQAMLLTTEGVEIIAMPQIQDDKLKQIKL